MKKFAVLLVAMMMFAVSANADDNQPIEVGQLPAAAQTFVKKYFPGKTVALATLDKELFDKSYDVIFSDGTKLEFDKKGQWKEVKAAKMPAGIVPTAVAQKVKSVAPGTTVVKIEKRDEGGYEVKLSNGMELEFNRQLQLVDIDD